MWQKTSAHGEEIANDEPDWNPLPSPPHDGDPGIYAPSKKLIFGERFTAVLTPRKCKVKENGGAIMDCISLAVFTPTILPGPLELYEFPSSLAATREAVTKQYETCALTDVDQHDCMSTMPS